MQQPQLPALPGSHPPSINSCTLDSSHLQGPTKTRCWSRADLFLWRVFIIQSDWKFPLLDWNLQWLIPNAVLTNGPMKSSCWKDTEWGLYKLTMLASIIIACIAVVPCIASLSSGQAEQRKPRNKAGAGQDFRAKVKGNSYLTFGCSNPRTLTREWV